MLTSASLLSLMFNDLDLFGKIASDKVAQAENCVLYAYSSNTIQVI